MKLALAEKVVVVTGGSRGIGLGIARAFAEENAKVTMIARSAAALHEAATELAAETSKEAIYAITADATNPAEISKAFTDTVKRWGRIDVVVANAGGGRSVADALPAQGQFSAVWGNNFTSAEVVAREAIPHLEKSQGNLLFIASIAGIEAFGAPTDYSVAKSAVIALSKNLARKLAPRVRVNCIAPGNVFFPGGSWDEKVQKDPKKIEELIRTTVPMQRFGKPEEIAAAALFLCSEKADFITGSCLIVDGGQTTNLH